MTTQKYGYFDVPRHAGWEGQLFLLFEAIAPDDEHRRYGPVFENDTFIVRPYYWGECECDDWNDNTCSDNIGMAAHTEFCEYLKSNFVYKSTGFEMDWYKYPLRSATMNQNITLRQFSEMIIGCIGSLDQKDFE